MISASEPQRFRAIRAAAPADTPALLALAESTGIFRVNEVEELLGQTLSDLHAGRLGKGHQASLWTDEPSGSPSGWVYFAPDATADVWELFWIGVAPSRQGRGIGDELLRFVELSVRAAGGRSLIIATSSLPTFDSSRSFYANRGYAESGRVSDFYAAGDSKVIYTKNFLD